MTGLANDLNISETGFVSHNGAGIFHGRTLTAGTGINITNGTGVSGDPVISSTAALTDLHTARFIVASSTSGTGANYTSIAAAITAAQATGINSTIFIQPGTYTEDLTLVPGINICAYDCDAQTPNVTIVGTLTLTTAGTVSLSGLRLQTNGAAAIAVTGAAASLLRLNNCYLNFTNATGITFSSASASAGIAFVNCLGDLGTTGIKIFDHSSAGNMSFNWCFMLNSGASTTASTISAGFISSGYSGFSSPITTSGTAALGLGWSTINTELNNVTCLTCGGSGGHNFYFTDLKSGSAIAMVVTSTVSVQQFNVDCSNATSISGAGSLSYGSLTFGRSGGTSLIGVTTQIPIVQSNDAVKIKTPGAYPYTTIPQDAVILVDSSSARTITPLASPTTGQMHIIKDSVGSAAANNITITPSGKNIDNSASATINIAFGSMTIVYNGTQWNIV